MRLASCENPVPEDAVATSVSDGGQGFNHSDTKKLLESMSQGDEGNDGKKFSWAEESDIDAMVVGTRVKVTFSREGARRMRNMYEGKITGEGTKGRGTFAITYDDGDVEKDVALKVDPDSKVKSLQRKKRKI